jgi:sugar lactone lactonase YvrE
MSQQDRQPDGDERVLRMRLGRIVAMATLLVASCGYGGGGGGMSPPAPMATLAAFAGGVQGNGSADGTGAAAGFNMPEGLATDGAGNIYVADRGNLTIRKVTPAGAVTTIAGTPGVVGARVGDDRDGTGASASFSYPSGVAADSMGNVFVVEAYAIRKITPTGVVTTFAGTGTGGFADGSGTAAGFSDASGIATDGGGNVFVADSTNNTIRKITPTGVVTTLAGTAGIAAGSADGTGAAASFNNPLALATDSTGNVFVADSGNNTIRKITSAGVVSTFASGFNQPQGVAVDGAGNLYVTDGGTATIRKVTPAGAVTVFAGTPSVVGHSDGVGAAASFYFPLGVTIDGSGNIIVSDRDGATLRKITPAASVTTLAGAPNLMGGADGTGAAAAFNFPTALATDSSGNLYAADSGNSTIRKITPAGAVSTFAGTAGASGSADGTGTVARFSNPAGVATDAAGDLYVADTNNNTIRKITPSGVVTTFAGTADAISTPSSIATDSAGNVYVGETVINVILKITPSGVVTTFAGHDDALSLDCVCADGTGAAAEFSNPVGIATDSVGNVYVADSLNNTIRKITPAAVVTTLAGSAGLSGSADGTGAAARFDMPTSIVTDTSGNLYVADGWNSTVRKITPSGVVTTVVGQANVSSFAPGTLPGLIGQPAGLALYKGSLYITFNSGIAIVTNVP